MRLVARFLLAWGIGVTLVGGLAARPPDGESAALASSSPACARWTDRSWRAAPSTCLDSPARSTDLQTRPTASLAAYTQLQRLLDLDASIGVREDNSQALAGVQQLTPGALVRATSAEQQAFRLVERFHTIHGTTDTGGGTTQMATWHDGAPAAAAETHGRQGAYAGLPLQLSSLLKRHQAATEVATSSSPPTATIDRQRSFGVPSASASTSRSSSSSGGGSRLETDHEYELRDRIGRGHFGELWRAHRVDIHGQDTGGDLDHRYILKRLFVEKGFPTRLSGRREVHFGMKLAGVPGVARLVEWFEEDSALWLVFRDEGISLTQWLTETDAAGLTKPSDNWTRMRMQMSQIHTRASTATPTADNAVVTSHEGDASDHSPLFGPFLPSPPPSTVAVVSPAHPSTGADDSAVALRGNSRELPNGEQGRTLPAPPPHTDSALRSLADPPMPGDSTSDARCPSAHAHDDYRSLLFQLVQAVARLHQAGVTHRDLKSPNLLLQAQATATTASSAAPSIVLRVCDFGSALDDDTSLQDLLYPAGFEASKLDNTLAYAPPEVLFSSAPYSLTHPHSYDIWSIGIITLEMLLGGRENVWRLEERVQARIERRVEEEWRHEQQAMPEEERRSAPASDRELQRRKDVAVQFRAFIEYRVFKPVDESATPTDADQIEPEEQERQDDAHFQSLLQQYDPLGAGAPNIWLVKLIRVSRPHGEGSTPVGRWRLMSHSNCVYLFLAPSPLVTRASSVRGRRTDSLVLPRRAAPMSDLPRGIRTRTRTRVSCIHVRGKNRRAHEACCRLQLLTPSLFVAPFAGRQHRH